MILVRPLTALAVLSLAVTASAEDKVLWDHWYTVTAAGDVPYAAFNEKVTEKGDRIHMQTHLWKREEGYLNEENLGAFASNTDKLEPLIFNFQSVYRKAETRIDGTVGVDSNGKKVLSVKINQAGKDLPPVRELLHDRVFLSSFFPVWIGRNCSKMRPKRTYAFRTVLEDNVEVHFRTVAGRAWLGDEDEYSKRTGSRRINVIYRDQQSIWYVDTQGAAVRIVMPKSSIVIDRSTRQEANAFLKPTPKPSTPAATSPAKNPAGTAPPKK